MPYSEILCLHEIILDKFANSQGLLFKEVSAIGN